MKSNKENRVKTIFYSICIVLTDQISKHLVLILLGFDKSKNIIPNLLNFTLVKNEGAAFKALMGGKKKPSRKEKDAEQQRLFRERQKQQMIQQGVNQKNAAARETMARAQELTNTTIQAVSKSNEKVMQGISIANQAVQRSAASSQGGGGGGGGGLMGFLKKTGAALLASQKGKS